MGLFCGTKQLNLILSYPSDFDDRGGLVHTKALASPRGGTREKRLVDGELLRKVQQACNFTKMGGLRPKEDEMRKNIGKILER